MVQEKVPSLNKANNRAIVTDVERPIIKAIKNKLPTLNLVRCWNHIFHEIRIWFKDTKSKSKDTDYYKDEVCRLYGSKIEHEYQKSTRDSHVKWDKAFQELPLQYGKHRRWNLEKFGIYSPESSITNKCTESLNRYVTYSLNTSYSTAASALREIKYEGVVERQI